MIVVAILGLIAVLTVPNLVNKNVERTNRTKVRKAMAVYEQALNNMVVSNQLKSDEDINTLNGDNCSKTLNYFKISASNSTHPCQFKTSDNLWWDITDIKKPIISFKKENLTNEKAVDLKTNDAFYLLGHFDSGARLRIDDNQYETQYGTTENINAMIKLWYYFENKILSQKGTIAQCKSSGAYICEVCQSEDNCTIFHQFLGTDYYVTEPTPRQREDKNYDWATAAKNTLPDSNGSCPAKEANPSAICSSCTHADCQSKGDYWTAAKNSCILQGGHLMTAIEANKMYSQKPTFFSSGGGNFWLDYSNSTNGGLMVGATGSNTSSVRYDNGRRIVCVGNE